MICLIFTEGKFVEQIAKRIMPSEINFAFHVLDDELLKGRLTVTASALSIDYEMLYSRAR